MKKGFTLVELLGVIVLIAAISLFLIPAVDRQIKQGKDKVYQQQIKNIELAAQLFYSDLPVKLDKNESMLITLSQLKFADKIDKNISIPDTGELFANDMQIEIKNEDGVISYHVNLDSGTDKTEVDGNTPHLSLNGNVLIYVNLNDTNGYTDQGAIAKVGSKNITVTTTNSGFDISTPGVYRYTYQATYEGKTSYAIRTVIVKDMEAPLISFDDTIKKFTSAPKEEDLLSDITVTDNSGEVLVPKIENSFGTYTGNYTIKYIVKDSSGNEAIKLRTINVRNCSSLIGSQYVFDYTGSAQTFLASCPGKYKLEVWGAEGGYRSNTTYAGKGGYASGTLNLSTETTLYAYVGGSGNTGVCASSICAGGYNGGGYRYQYKGGGGATDIRLTGGDWDNSASLLSRIIVAGGGGSDGATNKKGMYGGGTTGGAATESYGSYGYGGTQTGFTTSVTAATTQYKANGTDNYPGGFGFGGFGINASSGYAGAGGGGWYGGCGSKPDGSGDDDRGGGGGSGFTFTASSTNLPSGYSVSTSYQLTDPSLIAGNATITNPDGTTSTGHAGNGYARITYLGTI